MLLLSVYLGRRRGTLPQEEARRILDALAKVPQQMRDVLAKAEEVKYLAKKYMRSRDMLFLGRGTGYPIALEGALKLKEISYIHAEGYAAGEMKHGPIALIDEEMPVVVVCPRDAHYEKTFSNMQEVQARAGQLIAVCTQGDRDVRTLLSADDAPRSTRRASAPPPEPDLVEIPVAEPEVLPMLEVIPLQLLAYHMADLKGTGRRPATESREDRHRGIGVVVSLRRTRLRARWPPSSSANGRTGAATAAVCARWPPRSSGRDRRLPGRGDRSTEVTSTRCASSGRT